MKHLWCVFLLPLLAASACGQTIQQDQLATSRVQVAAMIDSLYNEVVTRHPLGTPDREIFRPYLSKGLLHNLDLDDACANAWARRNTDPNIKPDVGMIEFDIFSGGVEKTEPQAFHIEKVEADKDDSYRVRVKLTHTESSYKLTWYVVAVVIRENGRFVVDDMLYLKQEDRDESRLSKEIKEDCARSRL